MANPNDLNATVNIIVPENTTQQSKDDGRKLNKGKGRGANYRGIHEINFTSVAKLGLALRQVRMASEMVGSYTGDRLTQRRINTALTFAQYGIGIAVAGPIGFAYIAGDLAYRIANERIEVSKQNQISGYLRNLSGNNARNQSRSSGEKL